MKIDINVRGVTYVLIALIFILGYTSIASADSPTRGEIVIDKETSTTTSPSPPVDRVDSKVDPVIRKSNFPQTGELMKPVLLILGGMLIIFGFLGLFIVKTAKDSDE